MEQREMILPGHKISGNLEDIGIVGNNCPYCFEFVRSDEYPPHPKCPHLNQIAGGCGVSAAFYFYDPPKEVY